ncbi:hypothetical protein BUALT_Bualt14G0016200 [Buddleja alternifolia]|uniref:Myb-like domain-containing protein n=1 Tax=Buddleja alternifolia TaxID=168488 RepID=A0AAV6WM08_9LAMI|nr:hypothetical protein BUALT_Bualt14G0016200 [Buddleja alternifolia]
MVNGMASSSGAFKEGNNNNNNQVHAGSCSSTSSSSYNNNNINININGGCNSTNSVHGRVNGGSSDQWGVPSFQHQPQSISMDWTPDEQAQLEQGLAQYASESNIIRYAKIAVQLKNKTVRDVALRCRWMTKKEISKRRKEDFNSRKCKDRKDKVTDSLAKLSRLAIQSGLPHGPVMVPNSNDDIISYNDIGGITRQLLQQNAWAFKQISANLATHQIHENIGLLSQARENIFKILTNLNGMCPTLKKMPPLPSVNEELANSILSPTIFPIQ